MCCSNPVLFAGKRVYVETACQEEYKAKSYMLLIILQGIMINTISVSVIFSILLEIIQILIPEGKLEITAFGYFCI